MKILHYENMVLYGSITNMHYSKYSQLKLTNSSDSNCVGRRNSNDRKRNTTLDYIEGSIGKVWKHFITNYPLKCYHYHDIQVMIDHDDGTSCTIAQL